jgi:plastocyanin
MKSTLYYLGILAPSILVLIGPASFATTTTDPAQLTETTDPTEQTSSPEGTATVSIGEGSNETIQHYTYTPQSVEINVGESVTWFSSAEFADIHTVTFVQDPSIVSDIFLPFAAPASILIDLELVPPFNLGEPLIILTPDGRQAIVTLNKHAFYPAMLDANNQTTYLEGTDIHVTLNSSVKALNSGIILYVSFALLEAPPMSPTSGAQLSSTETGTTGEPEIASEASLVNGTDTTTITNATSTTTDVLTVPGVRGTFQPTEGGTVEELYFSGFGPPFPVVSSFTVTFEEPGTYPYFCAIHPWMVGQVVVR